VSYDAGNAEHVKARKKEDRLRRLQIDEGFRRVMGDQAGRHWVWDFLEFCSIFQTSFSPSNAQTAFNEGQRNAGLRVMADIHRLCPEQYLRMVTENQPKERDHDA